MHISWEDIINWMIVIPAFTGLIRLKEVDKVFYPFIILLCLGVLNEFVSHYCAIKFRTNLPNSNIFHLVDSLLVVYQFMRWKLFENKKVGPLFLFSLPLLWLANKIFLESFTEYGSYFVILYSFLVVLFSISLLNKILSYIEKAILKNATFIICVIFIILYTYNAVTEIFYKLSLDQGYRFTITMHYIYIFINLFSNILFIYAILCMHRKQRYSVPY